MIQIALDNGIQQEDLANFMNEVHKHGFANAVKDGVITQEQADWMLQQMQNRGVAYGRCMIGDRIYKTHHDITIPKYKKPETL